MTVSSRYEIGILHAPRTAPGDNILIRASKNVILFRRQFPFRKDSRLPTQLQRAMAAEAEAAREAKAKIIRSDAELKATTYITRAAEVLSESSGGMQLRYLQVSPGSSTKCNAPCPMPSGAEIVFSLLQA